MEAFSDLIQIFLCSTFYECRFLNSFYAKEEIFFVILVHPREIFRNF